MNLAVDHVSSAVGGKAIPETRDIDDMFLEWANEGLREALQAGRAAEAASYKRALNHIASVKAGRQIKVAMEDENHSGRSSPMRSTASRSITRKLRLVAAA